MMDDFFLFSICFGMSSGRMLPLRPPSGKPSALVCTYAATGHNSAVLTLDVTEDYMFTGSKGITMVCLCVCLSVCLFCLVKFRAI